jgi:hypothetical protein
VPEIRATPQAAGAQYAARDVTPHLQPRLESHLDSLLEADDPGLTLDLAPAYPVPGLARWRRDARLDRRARCVRVTEQWEARDDGGEARTLIHLMLAGSVELGEGRALVEAIDGGGKALISWEPSKAPATVTVRGLEDPWLADVWGKRLTRLEIDVTGLGPTGSFVWRVARRT